jgi:hypothetical protein
MKLLQSWQLATDWCLQMMRTLARNMAFLMKSIALGKEQYGIPSKEPFQGTNFIR